MKEIPLLTKEDIECRIQKITNEGAVLLLYKTARADMRILDEVVGNMNWQRHHEVINGNLFCTISIYDPEKGQWISKQDCGVPSNMQGEKGESSDAFKRAGFSWGIGRELYDSPFIWISGKVDKYDRFHVTEIQYDRDKREFTRLVICDDKGKERYRLNKVKTISTQEEYARRRKGIKAISDFVKEHNMPDAAFAIFLGELMNVDRMDDLTSEQLATVYKELKRRLGS